MCLYVYSSEVVIPDVLITASRTGKLDISELRNRNSNPVQLYKRPDVNKMDFNSSYSAFHQDSYNSTINNILS
jgi:hypothetical protein